MAHCTLALGPDAAGGLLRELIDGARTRLDVAVYETGPSYAALLAAAARRDLGVRLLLDAHTGANATATRVVAGSGVACRVLGGHPGIEAHWKLVLAGDDTFATGTGNLVRRDAPEPGRPGTREWWARVDGAPRLLAAARRAFDGAWHDAGPPPLAWRRAVAPPSAVPPVGVPPHRTAPLRLDVAEARLHFASGGAAVAALLAERITAAQRRTLAFVPYVHTHVEAVRALLDALEQVAARGGDARLLLGTSPDLADAAALSARTPLHVRVMDPLRCTTGHAKGLVADGAAVVASANWSGAGLGGNRESALLIDDEAAADWFAAALERDWALARPLPHPSNG